MIRAGTAAARSARPWRPASVTLRLPGNNPRVPVRGPSPVAGRCPGPRRPGGHRRGARVRPAAPASRPAAGAAICRERRPAGIGHSGHRGYRGRKCAPEGAGSSPLTGWRCRGPGDAGTVVRAGLKVPAGLDLARRGNQKSACCLICEHFAHSMHGQIAHNGLRNGHRVCKVACKWLLWQPVPPRRTRARDRGRSARGIAEGRMGSRKIRARDRGRSARGTGEGPAPGTAEGPRPGTGAAAVAGLRPARKKNLQLFRLR